MHKVANIDYILETQKYIEDHKNVMPDKVYNFIAEVCRDEKKYLDLVQQWGKEKKVFKVPEVKAMKY